MFSSRIFQTFLEQRFHKQLRIAASESNKLKLSKYIFEHCQR